MSEWMLPAEFAFSQGSLQDYSDCPRRFWLRYVRHVAWPAVVAEPLAEHESQLQRGELFHRLVHQHGLGVPADLIERSAEAMDDLLRPAGEGEGNATTPKAGLVAWWRNYLSTPPPDLPGSGPREIVLAATVADHRLMAKYDWIAVEPGVRAVIVDWKTAHTRTPRPRLATRLQTRVYRWLLVEAGQSLNRGKPWGPGQITMVYWYANFPDQPETFLYDEGQHRADGRFLTDLITEIVTRPGEDAFPLTTDTRRCAYCVFRSLCERGEEAGQLAGDDELEPDEMALDLDQGFEFGQIAEIEF